MSEGRAALEAALALKPDYAEAHWNRSHWHLLHGEFRSGWAEYEWRLKCPGLNSYGRSFDVPLWDGGPLDGRTIYIHWEQGFGDTIQFVRFMPLVKARGGRVVFECQAALANLFETLPGVDLLVTPEDNYVEFDCYAALLSLPHLLGTGLDSIPPTPFLTSRRHGLSASIFRRKKPQGEGRYGSGWSGPGGRRTATTETGRSRWMHWDRCSMCRAAGSTASSSERPERRSALRGGRRQSD